MPGAESGILSRFAAETNSPEAWGFLRDKQDYFVRLVLRSPLLQSFAG